MADSVARGTRTARKTIARHADASRLVDAEISRLSPTADRHGRLPGADVDDLDEILNYIEGIEAMFGN